MSTSPAERPDPGLVTFTARGNDALDRLAADLVDQCDGSTASIAEIVDLCGGQVDVKELTRLSRIPPVPAAPGVMS